MRRFAMVRAGKGERERPMAEDGAGIGEISLRHGWQQATQRAAFRAAGQEIIPQNEEFPRRYDREGRQAARR